MFIIRIYDTHNELTDTLTAADYEDALESARFATPSSWTYTIEKEV